ncbi:MAG: hypothetical protein KGQ58_01570 [Proteobacteria bacterium]|nr:hypothetical protein [Pseudomonadota bacterium]MDE3207989.1 hypothetical protein [Pseudomonadota bacterium]
MNEDTFNMSVRGFLKKVGVHSQRQIEETVAAGLANGKLHGNETLPIKMTLTFEGMSKPLSFEDNIRLD